MAQRRKSTPMKVQQVTPPSLYTCIRGTHTLRYLSTSGVTLAPTINDLADLMFVATSATSAARIFDSIRLKRIQMWYAASSSTTSAVAFVEDINLSGSAGVGAPSMTKLSAQPSPGENGYLDYRPKKGSVQNNWFSTSSSNGQNILRIYAPQNATIDITFEYTLADGVDAPTSVSRSIAGASLGQIYASIFKGYWVPQGVANI